MLSFKVFMKNGIDHFTDMMPALHNYITIDTDAFLMDEKRLLAIYNMCKEIFTKGKLLTTLTVFVHNRIGCVYIVNLETLTAFTLISGNMY